MDTIESLRAELAEGRDADYVRTLLERVKANLGDREHAERALVAMYAQLRADLERAREELATAERVAREDLCKVLDERDDALRTYRCVEETDVYRELHEQHIAAERERDAARAELAKVRAVLQLSEIDVALERSWCRICRTEGRGDRRGRDRHPHEPSCPLAATPPAARPERGGECYERGCDGDCGYGAPEEPAPPAASAGEVVTHEQASENLEALADGRILPLIARRRTADVVRRYIRERSAKDEAAAARAAKVAAAIERYFELASHVREREDGRHYNHLLAPLNAALRAIAEHPVSAEGES